MESIATWIGPVLLVGFLLLAFRIATRLEETRVQKKMAFAAEQGLEFWGDGLPPDLPDELIRRIGVDTRDCITGSRSGERVVTFQYLRGRGRNQRWLTVIGLKQLHPQPMKSSWKLGRSARYGDWALLSQGGFALLPMRMSQILEAWDALRTTSEHEAQTTTAEKVGSNLVIRPRHKQADSIS